MTLALLRGKWLPRLNRRDLLCAAAGASAALAFPMSARANEIVEMVPNPVRDPSLYRAYIPAACKAGQFFHYTCEFDASWAVLKTFGIDASLEEQFGTMEFDTRVEPYYEETPEGVLIHGGDIGRAWSGDYYENFLARCTGPAIRGVFESYGLETHRIRSRRGIQQSLDAGRLVWIKATVDFLDWVPATWVTPDGLRYPVVLGNDHAVVVMGYDDQVAVIRDVLGPTNTNWNRAFEYEVEWATFMRCWAAQGKDGIAVGLSDDA
jgi:hypothetical protein